MISWTEGDRLLLINAVMCVEEEIRKQSNIEPIGSSPGMAMGKGKWKRVTNLLPPAFQERILEGSDSYRCMQLFHGLTRAFQEGKQKTHIPRCYVLTKSVRGLLTKREGLLDTKTSVQSLKFPEDRILLIKAVMQVEEEMLSETWNPGQPSTGTLMGKWERVAGLLAPALQEITDNSAHRCRFTFGNIVRSFRQGKSITRPIHELLRKREDLLRSRTASKCRNAGRIECRNARRVVYTEGERVLVIKAVMHVEEQLRNKTSKEGGPSTGKPTGKWEWVASLLPPGLRESYRDNDPKCRSVFNTVLHAYKAETSGRRNGSNRCRLTEPIRDLLKKRRDLMNFLTSTAVKNGSKSGSSNRVRKAEKISEQSNDLHRTEVPLPFDNNAEEIQRSMERNDSISSFRSASRSLRVPHGYDKKNRPARSTVRSSSRSVSESRDAANVEKPSAQPGVQTRGQIRTQKMDRHSCTGPPSNVSPGSRPMRRSNPSMPHTTYDEHKHTALDKSLRKIDQEFCCLSSWLQSQSIPVAKTVLKERVTSACGSTKRRKLNIHTWIEPFDGLIHESLRSRMDLQICASFQKLKFRFAQELRNTTVELAQEVLLVSQ